jgi:hypothetical protein
MVCCVATLYVNKHDVKEISFAVLLIDGKPNL